MGKINYERSNLAIGQIEGVRKLGFLEKLLLINTYNRAAKLQPDVLKNSADEIIAAVSNGRGRIDITLWDHPDPSTSVKYELNVVYGADYGSELQPHISLNRNTHSDDETGVSSASYDSLVAAEENSLTLSDARAVLARVSRLQANLAR